MFQITANVGAAGDPKASMGSYSQAYGTIYKSALQSLPISKSSQQHEQGIWKCSNQVKYSSSYESPNWASNSKWEQNITGIWQFRQLKENVLFIVWNKGLLSSGQTNRKENLIPLPSGLTRQGHSTICSHTVRTMNAVSSYSSFELLQKITENCNIVILECI